MMPYNWIWCLFATRRLCDNFARSKDAIYQYLTIDVRIWKRVSSNESNTTGCSIYTIWYNVVYLTLFNITDIMSSQTQTPCKMWALVLHSKVITWLTFIASKVHLNWISTLCSGFNTITIVFYQKRCGLNSRFDVCYHWIPFENQNIGSSIEHWMECSIYHRSE